MPSLSSWCPARGRRPATPGSCMPSGGSSVIPTVILLSFVAGGCSRSGVVRRRSSCPRSWGAVRTTPRTWPGDVSVPFCPVRRRRGWTDPHPRRSAPWARTLEPVHRKLVRWQALRRGGLDFCHAGKGQGRTRLHRGKGRGTPPRGAGGQRHAPVERAAREEAGVEPGGRRGSRSVVVGHVRLHPRGTKNSPQQRADHQGHGAGEAATGGVGGAGSGQALVQGRLEPPTRRGGDRRGQGRVAIGCEQLEHGAAGGRGQRVSRQGPRLIDGTGRGQHGQDVLAPAERPDRQTAADHLAEAPQVGPDAGEGGGTALFRCGTR